MNMPHVAVVGGGLAGLQAAIACADAGVRVSLFEARGHIGGATWSTEKRGLRVDNGQHVFLRCCSIYRAFLARLGVEERVVLQRRLKVPVAAPGRPLAWIRRHPLPAPAHLAPSLLTFNHLPAAARLHMARVLHRFAALDPEDEQLDRCSLGAWLHAAGVGDPPSLAFWNLLVRPTLNLAAPEASLALAAKVIRTAFLEHADAADLGFARVPFADLHAEPSARALVACGASLHLRSPVVAVTCHPQGATLHLAGDSVQVDAVIIASPPETSARIAPREAGLDAALLGRLGRSPIVNLHVWFDRIVMHHSFVAGWDTPLEWVFDRTAAAGVDRGQVLTVSLSAADRWIGHSQAELRAHFLPAFTALFRAARDATVLDFFATSEPAATFRQVPGIRQLRPPVVTRHPAVFVAGAWTNTGWPATMEGAVRSGVAAAHATLHSLAAGLRRGAA